MRILVVEDDRNAARFLLQGLQEEGHAVDLAMDGEEATALGRRNAYDVIVLDVMLPKRSGLDVTAELRRGGAQVPILIITARDTTADVVRGLDAGADDYITKPFALDEFLARVRALGRRQGAGPAGELKFADIQMDRLARRVRRGGRVLDLSPREFRLLEYFLLHPDEVISRTRLLEKVWDMSFDPETNVIDAHVSNLRRKLEMGGADRLIHTVRGAGYALRLRQHG